MQAQAPTPTPAFTITELVYEPMCSSLDPVDRALWISEAIARAAELEGEVGDLRDRVDELAAAVEECEEAQEEALKMKRERDEAVVERDTSRKRVEKLERELQAANEGGKMSEASLELSAMLRDLVAAFEATKIGKMARVGSLVILAPGGSVAEALGGLVAKARALVGDAT
jgi:vacuolar-type H+-ATPase subunit I/STV1